MLGGSWGNDSLYGENGNDFIGGGNGNDTIRGGNGNDSIGGGEGNDILNGGSGNDSLNGENGNDSLNGGFENDILYGENGDDSLNGFWHDDILYGGYRGNDSLLGGKGNDYLDGYKGNDTLLGGAGADKFIGHFHSFDFVLRVNFDGSTTKVFDGREGNFTLIKDFNLREGDRLILDSRYKYQYNPESFTQGTGTYISLDGDRIGGLQNIGLDEARNILANYTDFLSTLPFSL